MNNHFEVTVLETEKLSTLPGAWTPTACRALLDVLEFDGVEALSDEEMASYATMALQDLAPEEAAALVLTHVLEGKLKEGQIRNLSEEMKDERQWEQNADMRCHEPIFNAQVMLHEAFPETYPAPDVLRMKLRVAALSAAGDEILQKPLTEAFLVRILVEGMPDDAILKRLFSDAIAEGPFPEASQILWHYAAELAPPTEACRTHCTLTLCSPRYWMGPLEDVETFSSTHLPENP